MTVYTKPEEVLAVQWLGDNLPALMELPQAKACLWWDRNEIGQEMLFLVQRGFMKPVSINDWIVVSSDFQFEVCGPEEVNKKYDFSKEEKPVPERTHTELMYLAEYIAMHGWQRNEKGYWSNKYYGGKVETIKLISIFRGENKL
jgi:hypothetical protein